ncbi:MAG TPA: MATE family efflux transporter [Clostridiales bacterium]|nr:MATE family efflux transporter [Clostridiales bacterium]
MVKDLTVGKPWKVLFTFSLPMLGSVVFQQIYNIADSMIAGQFVGEDALAAVGASYPITMLFLAVAMGCNLGCSVVISQLFGAKKIRDMKTAINTSFIFSLSISVVLTVVGLIFCDKLMMLVNTPENIFADSSLYLGIYIGGIVFLFLYNICTGVFTALGDSKTPLYLLIGSSVGNILLDLLLVINFHMGVSGVAWATFIAQGAASVLSLIILITRVKAIKCDKKPQYFSMFMLRRIARIAIPSILQQSFVSVGNMFVQCIINSYGSTVIAGYSAAVKLNTFTLTCITTTSNGLSSFVAQNIGAGIIKRVKKGLIASVILVEGIAILFTAMYVLFGQQFMGMFMDSNASSDALNVGIEFLLIIAPFYAVVSMKLVLDAVFRGTGAMAAFMTSTFLDLILRVALAFVLSPIYGITGVWLSWPIGWLVGMGCSVILYFAGVWKPKHVLTNN